MKNLAPKPYLSLESISLRYAKSNLAVQNVSLQLSEGELGCLLGPSGCGKTSILRAITGFQPIETGEISLANQTLSSSKFSMAPEKRNIGMVFQDHALYPHLTVEQNIAFGLQRMDRTARADRTNTLLNLVGLEPQRTQYPHELSGGQSQRVALARAIAPQPRLLLLDEPFSNLDTEMRESLGYQVRSLLKELNITSILVTHDQHDAFALGDRVAVMRAGAIEQVDTPFNLYHTPANRFVAQFIGDGVFVKGQKVASNKIVTGFGELVGEIIASPTTSVECELLLRPDDVTLDPDAPIQGTITRKAFKGAQTLYTLSLECGESLLALAPSHDDYEIGDQVGIAISADHLVCF